MTHFDAATAAVQAALDAGRPVRRRPGDAPAHRVDVGAQRRDRGAVPGRDARASACARWSAPAGASTPYPTCPTPPPARPARRAAQIAAASASRARARRPTWCRCAVATGALGLAPARSTRCRCPCPTRATCWSTSPRRCRSSGADLAEGIYQIWDTAKWFVSSEGHRDRPAHPRVRRGHHRAPRSATARRSAGPGRTHRGQYGTRGWELVDRARPGRARRPDRPRRRGRC